MGAIEYDADELEQLSNAIEMVSGRKNYCTKVHSMKNSASTIGIIPLAGMAKVLEDAARKDDITTLEAMTPVFLEYWRSYKEKLSAFSKVKKDNKKVANDYQEEINELLQRIKKAAEDMDIDQLDQIWSQLEEYRFDEEQQVVMEKIHRAIVDFDVDFLQGFH